MAKKSFRETTWFKMGQAEEDTSDEAVVPLPIEDRYTESATAEDSRAFGLHTGTTEYVATIHIESDDDVSMKALVSEMKHSKRSMLAIGAGIAAACTAFALYLI
ncbi:MAG: hypothetical protein M4D80_29905 [Myxococcota bacterium]|nr:hypothetical protein [Deltaproteobacteria bacterium]MDQ3339400.1 hypothetical protein [Myxococcota bacterium]